MRVRFIVLGFVLVLSPAVSTHAQTTIDASRVTCDQFVHSKVGSPRLVGAWLAGFYNGKRDKRVIDIQDFEENLNKLEQFCYQEKNFKLPVMQAIESVFGAGR